LLDILARTGEGAVVDLRALPRIGPLGYGFLKDWLSIGEVHAVISGLRQSEIRETAFAGVWWVTHRNEKDEIVTELLEVTEIPSLLKSQQEDIVAGLKTMRDVLPVR
jgi:hydrogenase-1 operon protein HyaF